MAKAFSAIKPTKLAWEDVLPIGKFKGCRICDIAAENYDYLIWLEKNTALLYNNEIVGKLKALANFENEQRHFKEEVLPFKSDNQWYDDVPF